MKNILTIVFIVTFSTILKSQTEDQSILPLKANNISLNGLGSPASPIGISYSKMLSNRTSIEIGTKILGAGTKILGAGTGTESLGAGAGVTYYLTNPRQQRFNFYTGASGMFSYFTNSYYFYRIRIPIPITSPYPSLRLYVPVGASYFGKKNFQYSTDIGLQYSVKYRGDFSIVETNPSFWFGVKVGYRFGEDINVLKAELPTDNKNILSVTSGYSAILLGIVYERLVTPSCGLEVGVGLFSATIGMKYYFLPVASGRGSLYTGVSESWSPVGYIDGFITYIPLGGSYLGKNNLRYSLDAGPALLSYSTNDDAISPSFNLRIGYSF